MFKHMHLITALGMALAATSVRAEPTAVSTPSSPAESVRKDIETQLGFLPNFFRAVPEVVLPGLWGEFRSLRINDSTALPCKIKELIALAVSSQTACKACTYGATEIAKATGATEQEIGEAAALASLTRHWSTFMNGIQIELGKHQAEVDNAVARLRSAPTPPPRAPAPQTVKDAKSARAEVRQLFGGVPEFLERFPDVAVSGAWQQMRDVEVSSATALPGKYKSLIMLAVAAQIPCSYCTYAETEFAKLAGATDAEITEAVAMAALAREITTLFDGMQLDESAERKDLDRIAHGIRTRRAKAESPTAVMPVTHTTSRR